MPDRPESVARLDHGSGGPAGEGCGTGSGGRAASAATWLVAATALAFVVNVVSDRVIPPDGFYDLYAGRFIARHGIPHRNVLTAASHGAPWIDQQWLAHLAYYGAWALGGYPAVAVLSAALVSSGFTVLGLTMLARGVPASRMFGWCAAALLACAGNTVIRAQSFGYLFFALTLYLIVADIRVPRPRARTWMALLAVLVAWANTHGSVLAGAGLAAGYAGYRAVRAFRRDRGAAAAYLTLGVLGAASVVCTPYGAGTARFYRSVEEVTPALARDIPEWAPPSPLSPVSWGFFALALVVAAVLVVAWRRGARPDPVLAAAAVLLLGLALTAVRNQMWFALAASLFAADTLARVPGARMADLSRAFRLTASGILAAAATVGCAILVTTPVSQFEGQVPVGALAVTAQLAARAPGARVLGDDVCGPALLWLHPALVGRVGFDTRLEQYTPAQLGAYARFLAGPGSAWQQVMRPYDIVVVSRVFRPHLAGALSRLAGWSIADDRGGGLAVTRQPGLVIDR